ncbi:T9SS type A sorting domain-containing protein [Spirosoma koreense]
MKYNLIYILVGLLLLTGLPTLAQKGSDPAVTSRDLQPAPLDNVGSPFSMTFTIGNNGAVNIQGNIPVNQMGFSICLKKCKLNAANPIEALSGELLNYFDITINPSTGCLDAVQKVAIPATTVYDLYIAAVVTEASSTTTVNDIGADCNISPNSSSNPQPSDNDFASIYTHTTSTELPVSLVKFTAQVQTDQTVLLNWSTSWEQANKGYIIERTKDLKNFEAVGEVKDVAGTSNSLNSYRFVDGSPYRGTSYYRLRQIDLNGTDHTFPVVSVVVRDEPYGVYPNPVRDNRFTLALDEPQQATVNLYNALGSRISLQAKALDNEHLELHSQSTLSAGVYVLRVEERGQIRQYRVVVNP